MAIFSRLFGTLSTATTKRNYVVSLFKSKDDSFVRQRYLLIREQPNILTCFLFHDDFMAF